MRKNRENLLVAMVLVAATLAVYAGALHGQFLVNWDDSLYVSENPAVRGFSMAHAKEAFTNFYVGNYAPIQILSYMADHALWGLRPGGYIFTNILLHAANGVLFYLLLMRLGTRRAAAFVAAFVFLFHPVQVESVAWISQRKNVLSLFFSLCCIFCYLSYRAGRGRAPLWLGSSCLLYFLAVLTKSVAVVILPALMLYELCFLSKEERRGWLVNKVPFLAGTVGIVILTLKSQSAVITEGNALFQTSSPLGTFYTMLTVLARYFGLIGWPTRLCAIYMPPVKFRIDASVAWSGVLFFCLIACGVLLYRRKRQLFFWYAFFFIGLLPVSQIVKIVTLMNDRYLYFPMLGAAAFFAGIVSPLITKGGKGRSLAAIAVLCVLLLPLPVLSAKRALVWRSDLTLWTDVVAKTPQSPQAWVQYGQAQYDAGNKDEALNGYLKALAIDPNYQFALNNIGGLYNEMGRVQEARQYLVQLLQLFPDYFPGYINLARNYLMTGELERAAATFRKALALQPGTPMVLASLGDVYLDLGRGEEARKWYGEALAQGGENGEVEYKLAEADALEGRAQEGLRHLEAAVALGFADRNRLMNAPRLAPLRRLPAFRDIVEGHR